MIGRIWRALILAAPVRVWAIILAAPPLTAFAGWLVWIVWKGPWPVASADHQLTILGQALLCALALIAIIVIALAAVHVRATLPGGSVEVGGAEEDRPA